MSRPGGCRAARRARFAALLHPVTGMHKRRSGPVTTKGTPGTAEDEESYSNELPVRGRQPGNVVIKWATTTDHKTIGTLYLVTSFAFFCIGGVMALFLRAQVCRPGSQLL